MIIDNIDNVEINLDNGHKYARRDIAAGEDIIKYGFPIGHAICDIKKGDRVSHKKFGEGLVLSVTPMNGDSQIEISFDNVGTRSLMASFAKLTKI